MDLLGTAVIVQLNVSSDVVGLLNLCLSAAQLAATIWFARRSRHRDVTSPRDADPVLNEASAPTAPIEALIAQLEAERRQRIGEAERLGAAIEALRGQS